MREGGREGGKEGKGWRGGWVRLKGVGEGGSWREESRHDGGRIALATMVCCFIFLTTVTCTSPVLLWMPLWMLSMEYAMWKQWWRGPQTDTSMNIVCWRHSLIF